MSKDDVDPATVRRLSKELGSMLRMERAIGTSCEIIEIVLLHALQIYKSDTKEEKL